MARPLSPMKQEALDEVARAVSIILSRIVMHSRDEAQALDGLWSLFSDMKDCLNDFYREHGRRNQ